MSELLEGLEPYIERVGLAAPIEVLEHAGPIASMYDPERAVHTIRHPRQVKPDDLEAFNKKRPYLASFLHELCHLHLAEEIAPSFAGLTSDGDADKKTRFGIIDNSLVDVWVNDLFNERFPEIFAAHHDNYAEESEDFIRKKLFANLLPPAIPYTLARSEAEAIRHDLRQVDFKRTLHRAGFDSRTVGSSSGRSFRGVLDPSLLTQLQFKTIDWLWDSLREAKGEETPKTMEDIASIREFLKDVPEISYDRTEALAMHEELANQFISVGRMAVSARLVDEDPRPVWYLT